MVNDLQKYTPNLSAVTVPMRKLLKEQNQFLWDNDIQGRVFEQVKQIISRAPVLKYFDPKADTELQCDASDKGPRCLSHARRAASGLCIKSHN